MIALTEISIDLSSVPDLMLLAAAAVAAIVSTYGLSRRQIRKDVDRVEHEALNASGVAITAWRSQAEAAIAKSTAQSVEIEALKTEVGSLKAELRKAQEIIYEMQRARHECEDQVKVLRSEVETLTVLVRGGVHGD